MDNLILETYLDTLQEDQLQEFEPLVLAGASAIVGVTLIYDLVTLFISASSLKHSLKMEPTLTKKLNKVLDKPEGYYTVRVMTDKMPNAFTLGGKQLYITSGIKDMMTERELIAILLHEVYHSQSLHVLKQMAFRYPLLFICLGILLSAKAALGGPLVLLASLGPVYILINFIILNMIYAIPEISYNILFSKIQEYHSDEHTLQYGYGDDLISAFKKIQKIETKLKGNTKCEGFCKISEKINNTISAHPETKKRIENILRKKEVAELALSQNSKKLIEYVKSAFSIGV